MARKLIYCLASVLCVTNVAIAQSTRDTLTSQQPSQDRAPVKAGEPGPTDPATGMSRRENYDAQLNSGTTDNSTGTAAGSDEQKAR